ncbi:MAG: nucleoside monophosphate kinase [Candidatus Woesearchaeota archaeon]
MKLILLGPPGSGKGTVSDTLVNKLHLFHISPGELLREEVRKQTTIGKEIAKYIEKGELVPNKFVVEMVKLEIGKRKSFVLDGFPRSVEQAEEIKEISVDAVISLEVPEETVIERLSGRRICPKCNAGYHIKYIPPKKEGICDKCGEKLIQRKDDTPKTVKERFKVYHKETAPLVNYYARKRLLHQIDASPAPEEVSAAVFELIKELKKK